MFSLILITTCCHGSLFVIPWSDQHYPITQKSKIGQSDKITNLKYQRIMSQFSSKDNFMRKNCFSQNLYSFNFLCDFTNFSVPTNKCQQKSDYKSYLSLYIMVSKGLKCYVSSYKVLPPSQKFRLSPPLKVVVQIGSVS